MKVLQINVIENGSTGRIMTYIKNKLIKDGHQCINLYGRGKRNKDINSIKIGSPLSFFIHASIATLFDLQGHLSYFKTRKAIKLINQYNPDIIHLHNIHGYYLNNKLLFNYIKKNFHGKVIWTLHDCISFTGHCSYFTEVDCKKWKTQCMNCPQKNRYPISMISDRSKEEYKIKKENYSEIKNMKLTVPSNWSNSLVKESFMKNYECKTIHNFIDFNIFKFEIDTKILNKYNIPNNKKIYLGVSNVWEERKGLNIFKEISTKLNNDEIIVLVGLTKKQIKNLPENIIGIKRTKDAKELANLYSIATVFINPSTEETFSLVTLEALACETPCVVLDTSAVKELVHFDKTGTVVSKNTKEIINAMRKINYRVPQKTIKKLQEKYNPEVIINQYIDYYKTK